MTGASHKTVLVSISQLINYGLPLITFLLLVRTFDTTLYGVWIETMTIVGLLTTFGIHGLGNAVGAMILSRNGQEEAIYSNALYVFLMLAGALTLMMGLTAPGLNAITARHPLGSPVIQIASLQVLINALNWLASQVFRLRQQPVRGVAFDIALSLVRLGAVAFAFFQRDLLLFALVHVLSQMAVTIVQVAASYWGIALQRPSWPLIRELGHYAVNLSVVSQANWVVMYGDRLLLSLFAASAAVAIYSASYQLSLILVALGWPSLYFLLPALGERWRAGNTVGAQAVVRQATRAILIIVTPAVVGLALTGEALLRLLGNEDFARGSVLVGLIALGVALDVVGTAAQYIFYVRGEPQTLRRIYIWAAVFNVAVNLIAIPLFGYYGAGVTTLLTFLLIAILLWRQVKMPLNSSIDLSVLGRCVLASMVMGVYVALVVNTTVPGLIIAIAGGMVIYGLGLLALRIVSIGEMLELVRAPFRWGTPPVVEAAQDESREGPP
jgi:O-antigen/teichoic acid export membrane protein